MLLDELLIKIGIDADSAALKQIESFMQSVGDGANSAADKIEQFIQHIGGIEQIADDVVKGTPEIKALYDELAAVAEKSASLPQNEAVELWVSQFGKVGDVLSSIGEEFDLTGEVAEQVLREMGVDAETATQILTALSQAQKDNSEATQDNASAIGLSTKAKTTDKKATDAQIDALEKSGSETEQNTEKTEDLATALLALAATRHGIDDLGNKFELFGVKISKTKLLIAGVGAAFGALVAGVSAFVNSQLDELDAIHQLSRVTGESAKNIHLLGKVAEVNGSSAEAAQSSIEGLSRTIGEAAAGIGRGAKTFDQYGLSAKKANGEIKTSTEVMEELRQKMQRMSDQEQIAMLSKLGIDGSMIQTLRLTNEEMAEAIANAEALSLGVGTKENAEQAAAFKDAMTEFDQVIKSVGEYLALHLAPAIMRMIDRFKAWFITNNDLIKNGLSMLANTIGFIVTFIGEFIGAVDNIVSSTIGWEAAIYIVGAAIMWLSRTMLKAFAMNPIAWIIAAVVGLILIVEDLIGFLQGKQSLFAKFWAPMIEWCKKAWNNIKAFWDWLSREVSRVADLLTRPFRNAFNRIEGIWDNFKTKFDVNPIGAIFDLVTELIKQPFKFGFDMVASLWEIFTGQSFPLGSLEDAFKAVKGFIVSPFRNAFDRIEGIWDNFKTKFDVDPIGTIFDLVTELIKLPFKAGFDMVASLWEIFTGQSFPLGSLEDAFKAVKGFIVKPFEDAFKWVKTQYETYIKPIIDAVKRFNPFSDDSGGASPEQAGAALNNMMQMPAMIAQAQALPIQGAIADVNSDNSVKNSNNKVTVNNTFNTTTTEQAKAAADQAFRIATNMVSPVAQ